MTQHDKILNLNSDGSWHCQQEYRDLHIYSPHKRRSELELQGYRFEERPCEHYGHGQKDYRMSDTRPRVHYTVEGMPEKNFSVRAR